MNYDAVIVGSGPNGLVAGILLQQHGLSVLIIEGKEKIGGGLRTEELTLPGYLHDVCSAIHPLAIASPFFETLPLADYGLQYFSPDIAAAHPFDDGPAAILTDSIKDTTALLGGDGAAYLKLVEPIVANWQQLAPELLAPFHIPKHPLNLARFGWDGLKPATRLANIFNTAKAKGLFAGMAAHSIQPLTNMATSAVAMVLLATAHIKGWPITKGGSVSIANALAAHFKALGGTIETGTYITSLNQLPPAKAVLFDVTPRQILQIAGHKFSTVYKWQLERYRYGMGVFKIDWALDGPIPFKDENVRRGGYGAPG